MQLMKSRSFAEFTLRSGATNVLRMTGLLGVTSILFACSSAKTPSPATSGPTPTTASAADIGCPDNTDTPQIIEYTIGVRYRAYRQNKVNLIPGCYVEAVAAKMSAYPDSIVAVTLDMSDALYAQKPDDAANLAGRIALLARATRYREVSSNFDRLVRLDSSRATLANYRLAIAATMRGNDSTARLRYLTAAARKY